MSQDINLVEILLLLQVYTSNPEINIQQQIQLVGKLDGLYRYNSYLPLPLFTPTPNYIHKSYMHVQKLYNLGIFLKASFLSVPFYPLFAY
jgi:hypothetical protein